ncbi:carbohydrate-binding protein [Flavobacterium sp. NG2]|uniref:cellulase family glycosylhydrolase n=1 Tax=Flavobacterium sp. NG2 TaxID=3097547 RepID=UPI002A807411|nr:carbohydrate-binding protein [Flavobacterium sp. NG2]WPR70119.1 carbohydrate-binding protein [Flavobacterium sp. NG2]
MNKIYKMKLPNLISLLLLSTLSINAQVVLSADFTNNSNNKWELKDIWNVANRISPTTGAGVRTGFEVNTIRMVGGINKKVNGENVPDLDFDPVSYDTNTGTYVYNWNVLKNRINAIKRDGVKIYQFVLDQVPWAFQQGYTFIPTGTRDNINFREDERVTIYGNSLPPKDKVAYFNFIKAMMTELVATYGADEVLSWRFRVGSEIETPEHWKGTEQDFIDHFANTVRAVREVLPTATIGLHTREPDFIYKNGTELNYKGEPIKSFANGILDYCFANNIQYDFWGASEYVLINNSTDRNISQKYIKLFAPLINNPKWNPNAKFDMMEYAIVTTMDGADGLGYINCATPHTEIINLAYSNVFYRNSNKGLQNFFRWGQRPTSIEVPSIAVLKTMTGKNRYETTITGSPSVTGNQIDALFSKSATEKDVVDVLVYNLNASSLNYQNDESIRISFNSELPVGTVLKYRNLTYGKDQNDLENFLKNEPTSGWIKSGFDRRGDPSRTLNTAGAAAWASYTNPNPYAFNDWSYVTTTARTDGGSGSLVTINTSLSSFSFKKYEFRIKEVSTIAIPGTIEAESYNPGGQGVGFSDSDTVDTLGAGNGIDGVDVGIYNGSKYVGHTQNGEWLKYTVNVVNNGNHDFQFLYSAASAGSVVSIDVDGVPLFSNFSLPQTSGINDFKSVSKLKVALTSGVHELRINVQSGGFNLDKIIVETSGLKPFKTIVNIPGTVQIEDYALGGQGVAYNDTTLGNDTSGYRTENDVDLVAGGTGFVSTALAGGEYIRYPIYVTQSGVYHMELNYKTSSTTSKPIAAAILAADLSSSTPLFTDAGGSTTSGVIKKVDGGGGTIYADYISTSFNLYEGNWVIELQIPSGGAGPNYDYFTLVMDSPLGVKDFSKKDEGTKVFPNPSRDGIFNLSQSNSWKIYTLTGSEILSGEGAEINLAAFSKGIYLLKIKGESVKKLLYQ